MLGVVLVSFSHALVLFTQDELSKTDQEVMKSKHHRKHYEEKRQAHLLNIQSLEANVESMTRKLEVSNTGEQ